MPVTLLNTTSAGSFTRNKGTDTAALSSVFDLIVRERNYEISDPLGRFSPLSSKGLFYGLEWENAPIEETDSDGKVLYIGAINNVGYQIGKDGRKTSVTARDQFGVLIDWTVEDADLISFIGSTKQYTLTSLAAIGATGSLSIGASGSPSDIPVGAYVSFGLNIVPRYQVTAVTGSGPTTAITLDRPLEAAVAAGSVLRVIGPVVKSGPKALKDALVSAGLGDKIGYTFDRLAASDSTSGYNLRIFVRQESKIKLSDHLNKVMELTNTYITVNTETGVIDCFRGFQYDGTPIFDSIEPADQVLDITATFDKSKFYYAYDLPYANGGGIAIESGTVTSRAKKRWQPISYSSNKAIDFPVVYDTSVAARYFGQLVSSYYSVPRVRIRTGLKRAKSGHPRNFFNVSLGKRFLVTVRLGDGQVLSAQPAIVTAYTYDKQKQYYPSVELELTNWINPKSFEAAVQGVALAAESGDILSTEAYEEIGV